MRIPSGTCLLVLAHMKLCKMVALQGALLYGRLFRTHAKVPQCEREGMRLCMVSIFFGGGYYEKLEHRLSRCQAKINKFAEIRGTNFG